MSHVGSHLSLIIYYFLLPISRQEGKKVHTGGGFSGKGFKFDENEALAANEKKKIQKAVLGNILVLLISTIDEISLFYGKIILRRRNVRVPTYCTHIHVHMLYVLSIIDD